jgi:hypothetical protein
MVKRNRITLSGLNVSKISGILRLPISGLDTFFKCQNLQKRKNIELINRS